MKKMISASMALSVTWPPQVGPTSLKTPRCSDVVPAALARAFCDGDYRWLAWATPTRS